jgi:LmbE family N-acetylglucosaminyl deacetylase
MRGSAALAALALALATSASDQGGRAAGTQDGPKVLSIQAHPDDETIYSATLYAVSHHLRGAVDVVVLTDGSGGFDYAMLAEPIYDKPLADLRTHLPAVRKEELLEAGKIFGLRDVFFLDEFDHQYMLDADTTLRHVWDTVLVRAHLDRILRKGDYDVVFTLLPLESEHGHHKAASILALQAVAGLPEEERPAILGGMFSKVDEDISFSGLPTYPITTTAAAGPSFVFDRRRPLEPDSMLTYQVVVNWHLAEYKSQGITQTLMGLYDLEKFWLYEVNSAEARSRARSLFDRLDAWRP